MRVDLAGCSPTLAGAVQVNCSHRIESTQYAGCAHDRIDLVCEAYREDGADLLSTEGSAIRRAGCLETAGGGELLYRRLGEAAVVSEMSTAV